MSRHTQKIVGDFLYVSYIHSREGPRRKNCPVNTCIYARKNINYMYRNLYQFVHDDVHVCACWYLHFVCATAQVPETNLCHYVDLACLETYLSCRNSDWRGKALAAGFDFEHGLSGYP